MSSPLPNALPYGIRDCKLTPYLDSSGTVLGEVSYDLPNMQTFSFSEAEEFEDLRGDDRTVTTRGKGSTVEWEVESGGISMRAWSVFTGGQLIETGVSPNRKVTLRKRGTDARPYFRVDGQSISDSGGDVRALVYRCRCNDSIEGEFGDGEFFITSVSGVGLPLMDEANDLLYDFVQNESKTSIPLTPDPNPVGAPQNVTVGAVTGTSAELSWDASQNAESFVVEQSDDNGSTWTAVSSANGGEPSTNSTTVKGLTSATTYIFRVSAVYNGGSQTSGPSKPTGTITTP